MLGALLVLALDLPPAARAALALWDEGRRVEAVDALASVVDGRPDDLETRTVLVEREIAIHRYRSAWEHLAGLGTEHDPTRGRVLYQLGRYEEAVPYLAGAEHVLARHDALTALGRMEEARAALDEAQRILGDEDPRVLTLVGVDLAVRGETAEAIHHFRAALEIDPLEQEARFALGRALVVLGEREEGLLVLSEHRRLVPLVDRRDFAFKSLDLAPRYAPNLAELGDCERSLGRTDAAREAYRRSFELAAGDQVTPIALRYARLLFEDDRDLSRALAVLDLAHARASDPHLLVRAGDYLADRGRDLEAAARFEAALELAPDAAVVRDRLARVRARLAEDR